MNPATVVSILFAVALSVFFAFAFPGLTAIQYLFVGIFLGHLENLLWRIHYNTSGYAVVRS